MNFFIKISMVLLSLILVGLSVYLYDETLNSFSLSASIILVVLFGIFAWFAFISVGSANDHISLLAYGSIVLFGLALTLYGFEYSIIVLIPILLFGGLTMLHENNMNAFSFRKLLFSYLPMYMIMLVIYFIIYFDFMHSAYSAYSGILALVIFYFIVVFAPIFYISVSFSREESSTS